MLLAWEKISDRIMDKGETGNGTSVLLLLSCMHLYRLRCVFSCSCLTLFPAGIFHGKTCTGHSAGPVL